LSEARIQDGRILERHDGTFDVLETDQA